MRAAVAGMLAIWSWKNGHFEMHIHSAMVHHSRGSVIFMHPRIVYGKYEIPKPQESILPPDRTKTVAAQPTDYSPDQQLRAWATPRDCPLLRRF
jgi:hypothetical protein